MADGSGEFGGGGSVKWAIDVEDGDTPTIATKPTPRGYKVNSVDKHGSEGQYFEVAIEQPAGGVQMRVEGSRILLYLPIIQQTAPQIKVRWALKNLPSGIAPLTSGGTGS